MPWKTIQRQSELNLCFKFAVQMQSRKSSILSEKSFVNNLYLKKVLGLLISLVDSKKTSKYVAKDMHIAVEKVEMTLSDEILLVI